MGNRKEYLKHEIVKVCDKLDQKGFGANHDGNVSCRFEDTLLATPTAESKGNITKEMIISLDMEGKKIEGIGKPFSEIKLHLSAYNARDDIQAVVHAHPPYAMAYGLCNKPLHINVPEAIVSIGDLIPVTPFAMPGAPENDKIIKDALSVTNVFMMPGNGILSVGDNLEMAYLRLELVEHLLKIEHYAKTIGEPMTLDQNNKQKLLDKRASIGLDPKTLSKEPKVVASTVITNPHDQLKKLIAQEIRNVLGGN